MADFFGGILDSMRSSGDDVDAFFGSSLSKALARGLGAGYDSGKTTPEQDALSRNERLLEGANSISRENSFGNPGAEHSAYSPGYRPVDDRTQPAKSVNFEDVEQAWLRRMLRFSQVESISPQINEKTGK